MENSSILLMKRQPIPTDSYVEVWFNWKFLTKYKNIDESKQKYILAQYNGSQFTQSNMFTVFDGQDTSMKIYR